MQGIILKARIVCENLKQWQIAQELGWSESRLSKILRGTVNKEDEKKIVDAIERLKNERSE